MLLYHLKSNLGQAPLLPYNFPYFLPTFGFSFAFFSANKPGTCETSANPRRCQPAFPPKAGTPSFGLAVTTAALPPFIGIVRWLWVTPLLDHWRLCVTSANPRPRQRRERAPWRRRPGRSTLGRVTLPARWIVRANPSRVSRRRAYAAFFSCYILPFFVVFHCG